MNGYGFRYVSFPGRCVTEEDLIEKLEMAANSLIPGDQEGKMMFDVKEIAPEMTYRIRHTVLRPHQNLKDCVYDTDFRGGSFHVGLFHHEELISIASFNLENHPFFNSDKQYHLRAMATLPSYRNMGAGRAVITYAEEKLKLMGFEIIWCHGRTGVQGYYEKLGFKSYGEVFDYPGLGPHIVMYKEV